MIDAVSVVMTTYREPSARLERAFRCIAAQRTAARVEVIVAGPPGDGEIPDAVARAALADVTVVANPGGRRTVGLNRAISAATGSVVCRVDARSRIPPEYLERCLRRLERDPSVGVVGGFQRPFAAKPGTIPAGVARALRNPYLLGAPAYRGTSSGPADTVYLGAWRRADLESLGGFDERLDANEDFELCRRFAAAGWVIWLEEGLDVPYEARAGFAAAFRQYHEFGRSKVKYWRLSGARPNRRQAAALGLGAAAVAAAPVVARRLHRLEGAGVAAALALLVVDHAADPTERDPALRVVGAWAGGCVVVGWLSGVAHELALSRS